MQTFGFVSLQFCSVRFMFSIISWSQQDSFIHWAVQDKGARRHVTVILMERSVRVQPHKHTQKMTPERCRCEFVCYKIKRWTLSRLKALLGASRVLSRVMLLVPLWATHAYNICAQMQTHINKAGIYIYIFSHTCTDSARHHYYRAAVTLLSGLFFYREEANTQLMAESFRFSAMCNINVCTQKPPYSNVYLMHASLAIIPSSVLTVRRRVYAFYHLKFRQFSRSGRKKLQLPDLFFSNRWQVEMRCLHIFLRDGDRGFLFLMTRWSEWRKEQKWFRWHEVHLEKISFPCRGKWGLDVEWNMLCREGVTDWWVRWLYFQISTCAFSAESDRRAAGGRRMTSQSCGCWVFEAFGCFDVYSEVFVKEARIESLSCCPDNTIISTHQDGSPITCPVNRLHGKIWRLNNICRLIFIHKLHNFWRAICCVSHRPPLQQAVVDRSHLL